MKWLVTPGLVLLALCFWSTPAHAAAAGGTFSADMNIAVRVAEHYWGHKIVGFQPVSKVVPYTEDGEVLCGSQPIPTQNAAYCPVGDFIAYDAKWSEEIYNTMGDAFVFYLLTHEYGHAIQQRLGISYQYTIFQELNADCLAGASLGDSVRTGDLDLETGDVQELKAGLVSVGDPKDEPWFQEGAHGTPEQRQLSFFDGYDKGLDGCGLHTSSLTPKPPVASTPPTTAPGLPGFPSTTPSTPDTNPFPGSTNPFPSTTTPYPGTRNPFPGWTNPLNPTPKWPFPICTFFTATA
ncbi:neutral zinc metallopeptidase [Dactylosporangium sp. NPDC051541]|uniref:neutral zinc metallopeptidase n=1 Tax=Dactylosporangium sp. NPDC051541 TaxID=3363977 RepID=UPI0037920F4B